MTNKGLLLSNDFLLIANMTFNEQINQEYVLFNDKKSYLCMFYGVFPARNIKTKNKQKTIRNI